MGRLLCSKVTLVGWGSQIGRLQVLPKTIWASSSGSHVFLAVCVGDVQAAAAKAAEEGISCEVRSRELSLTLGIDLRTSLEIFCERKAGVLTHDSSSLITRSLILLFASSLTGACLHVGLRKDHAENANLSNA